MNSLEMLADVESRMIAAMGSWTSCVQALSPDDPASIKSFVDRVREDQANLGPMITATRALFQKQGSTACREFEFLVSLERMFAEVGGAVTKFETEPGK